MTTDTVETGLETLILRHMTGTTGLAVLADCVAKRPTAYVHLGYFLTNACR